MSKMSDLHQSICELIYQGESVETIADILHVKQSLVAPVFYQVESSNHYSDDCDYSAIELTEEI